MESVEKGKQALIDSIRSDAGTEVQKIIAEAQTQVAEKQKDGQNRVDAILSDARQKAQQQADSIKHKILADVESELKKNFLQRQYDLMQDIQNRAEKKINSMIDGQSYRDILINWITEAALGLDTESAQINASAKERPMIDQQMIAAVIEKFKNITGKNLSLSMSQSEPLDSQGVTLTAANGRIAFNNQVRTRFLRNQRKIRVMIYNTLFSDNQKV